MISSQSYIAQTSQCARSTRPEEAFNNELRSHVSSRSRLRVIIDREANLSKIIEFADSPGRAGVQELK